MKDILEGVGERPWQQCDDFRHVIEDANGNHVCTADKPKFIIHVVNSFEARNQLIAELVSMIGSFIDYDQLNFNQQVDLIEHAESTLTRAKEVMKG